MSRMRVRSYPAGSVIYESTTDSGTDGGGNDIAAAAPGTGRLETLILLSGDLTEEREDIDDDDDDDESRPDGSVGSVYNELALLAPLTR